MKRENFGSEDPALPENINKKKNGNFKLLCEIKEICDKNNLEYFLAFGTALGAVRDKDIIEWDADIDIIITMKTLDFFMKNYPDKIMTNENTYFHYFTFPRFVPSVKEANIKDVNPLFIDMFVMFPSTHEAIRSYHKKKKNLYRGWITGKKINFYHRYKFKNGWNHAMVKIFLASLKPLGFKGTYEQLHVENGDKLALSTWPVEPGYDHTEIQPIDVKNKKTIKLRGLDFPVFDNIEKYLEQWYGNDWQTPAKKGGCIYYGYIENYKD